MSGQNINATQIAHIASSHVAALKKEEKNVRSDSSSSNSNSSVEDDMQNFTNAEKLAMTNPKPLLNWLKENAGYFGSDDEFDLISYLQDQLMKQEMNPGSKNIFANPKFIDEIKKLSGGGSGNDQDLLKDLENQPNPISPDSTLVKALAKDPNVSFEDLKEDAMKNGWGWMDGSGNINVTSYDKLSQFIQKQLTPTEITALKKDLEGSSDTVPSDVVNALKNHFSFAVFYDVYKQLGGKLSQNDLITLMQSKGWGYGDPNSFTLNGKHLQDLAQYLWANTTHTSDKQVVDDINNSHPKPPPSGDLTPAELSADLQQLLIQYQSKLGDFWNTDLGKALIKEFPHDNLQTLSYRDIIKWVSQAYGNNDLKNFINDNGSKNINEWLKEAEPSGPSGGGLNPPPPGSPKWLQDVYNTLSQLNGDQDWGKLWLGKDCIYPQDLTKRIDDLQSTIDTLKKNGVSASNKDMEAMQNELNKMQGVEKEYESLASKTYTYTTKDGHKVTLSLQDLLFGNSNKSGITIDGKPVGSIIDIYNQAIKGDASASAEIKDIADAVQQLTSNPDFQKNIQTLNSDKPQLVNNLLDSNSKFYTSLFNILIKYPKLVSDLPKDVTSMITHTAGANYVWGHIREGIDKSYDQWLKYFEGKGYSPQEAQAKASEIKTLFYNQALSIYNQLMKMKTDDPSQIFALLSKASKLTLPPSSFSPKTIDQILQMCDVQDPYAPIDPKTKKHLTYQQVLESLTSKEASWEKSLSEDDYQLQNDYAYLKVYEKKLQNAKGTERADLEKKVGSIEDDIKKLEIELTSVKKNILDIKSKISSYQDTFNSLSGKRFGTIIGWGKPGISFDQYQTDLNKQVGEPMSDFEKSSEYTQMDKDMTDLQAISKLCVELYSLDPSFFGKYGIGTDPNKPVSKDNPPSLFKNIMGDKSPGCWFDPSRIKLPEKGLKHTPLDQYTQALDYYFQEMAESGITSAKLAFSQLDPGAVAHTDTLHDLITAAEKAGIANPMQVLEEEASKYNVSIGTSIGGENATGKTLSLNGNPDKTAEDLFIDYGQYSPNGLDFDLEGQSLTDFINQNGKANVIEFFKKLHELCQNHKDAKGNSEPIPLQLTLAGSVGTYFEPLAFLLKDGDIDGINVMAYNDGDSAYIDPTNNDFGSLKDIHFILQNAEKAGLTPEEAMKMLHIGFEDKTPYNDPTKLHWGDGKQIDQEIFARTKRHLKDMSPGEAAEEVQEQNRIDTIKDWNKENPKNPLPEDAQFANSEFWTDSNRAPILDSTIAPSPEADFAAEEIRNAYGIPA